MFGSHLSISGGMVNALLEAKRLKMDCVQVFTANQRQWSPRPPDDAQRDEWLAGLIAVEWDFTAGDSPARVVSHNSYLTNLASPSSAAWKKSIDAQRREIERCESLRVPLCVIHPGAHLGSPRPRKSVNALDGKLSNDESAGLERIVDALDRIHRDLSGYRTITCLETTVGSGTNLGYDFHHLAFIRNHVKDPKRVGFCLDTCHVTAAGYDMTTPGKAAEILETWDAVCGLENLRVLHVNDSIGAVGSRLDRHAHVGEGCCGKSCFAAVVNHPALRNVPKILETPKGLDKAGTNWDTINIRRLKRMIERVD